MINWHLYLNYYSEFMALDHTVHVPFICYSHNSQLQLALREINETELYQVPFSRNAILYFLVSLTLPLWDGDFGEDKVGWDGRCKVASMTFF
ncbi:hypothetical protein QQP08_001153 [Theobroma cacao]|nr:hypothetical protein QQP08_001153 [Theobroma cacao]